MTDVIKKLPYNLTSKAGLALVGQYLKLLGISHGADRKFPVGEAVGRTDQGVDGYTPSATYLGSLGYCLELALRPGVQHSALETELDLERVLPMAAKLTPLPLLFHADSGLCSLKIMQEVSALAGALSREIAFIVKWNPRRAPVEAIAAQRVHDANTLWCHLREGKRMCLWTDTLNLDDAGRQGHDARHHRVVQRPCHARAVPFRVQDRHGYGAFAQRQV
jgi:hypothetical protein